MPNAPLVAAADRDLDSYLDAQGNADIFFATDFDWLAKAAYAAAGGVGAVAAVPPAEFFARSPDLAAETETPSGFNPMLEDFGIRGSFSRSGRVGCFLCCAVGRQPAAAKSHLSQR